MVTSTAARAIRKGVTHVSDTTSGTQHQTGVHTHAQFNDPLYQQLSEGEDFQELRRRYRAFVFPWTIAFLAWYLLFVALSNWAPDFMSTKVIGNVNLGLVLGLAQFATTFLIAWVYSRHAAARFDPLAAKIKAEFQAADSGKGSRA
jgi:uncharacterized membrane protein (DUF485 family)